MSGLKGLDSFLSSPFNYIKNDYPIYILNLTGKVKQETFSSKYTSSNNTIAIGKRTYKFHVENFVSFNSEEL
jgi:hypothetical protein